jgi:hypothetical protein
MGTAGIRAQLAKAREQLEQAACRRQEQALEELPPAARWLRVLEMLVVMLERQGATPGQLAPLRECIAVLAPAARSPGPRLNEVCDHAIVTVSQWLHGADPHLLACTREDHPGVLRAAIEADGAAGFPGRDGA